MTTIPQDPNSPAPYGAQSPRSAAPLVAAIVLYAAWFAFLFWMAVQYPAGS
jgi:hypothetical protein